MKIGISSGITSTGKAASAATPPAPVKSWQIVGQYNEVPVGQQAVTSINVRALTVARAKLAANNVTGLRSYGQGYYIGGNGGPEVNVGNDVPVRSAVVVDGVVLASSASPTTVPNGSALTQIADFSGLNLQSGAVLELRRERVLVATQLSTQTIPYATGTLPTGVGRKTDDGTGPSTLTSSNPGTLTVGSLEGDFWVAYGEHPPYTCGLMGDSIGYNNTDSALGDGGLIGSAGRTAEGGGMYRRGFRAAALATGVEIPLAMMAKPAAQMAIYRTDGARRREKYQFFNTLIIQVQTNDFDSSAGNKTVSQMSQYFEEEAAAFRAAWAAGPNSALPCYVVAVTPLPRQADTGSPSTTQQRIMDFCAVLKNGSLAGIDGYWDLNSVFSVPGSEWKIADTAKFNADLLHPSAAGHAAGAAYISAMLQQTVPWIPYAPIVGTPELEFSSSATTVAEGDSGSTTVSSVLNVTRNGVSGALNVLLSYSGTATSGTDYATPPSSVTIPSGQNSVSFDLSISGDLEVESDETIVITAELEEHSGVTASRTITITNEDVEPPEEFASIDDFVDYMGGDLLALWDAADPESLISSGGVCSQWIDRVSGITLTAYGSPTYSTTGFNSVAPGVVFNGTNQYFASASGALPGALPAGQGESWMYALVKNTQSDNNTRFVCAYGGSTNGTNRALRVITISGVKRFQAGAGGGIAHGDTSVNGLGEHIFGGQFVQGGGVMAGRIDGAPTNPQFTNTVSWNTSTVTTTVVIGAANSLAASTMWQGAISLIMILGPAISLDKLQMVEGVMNSRVDGNL